eukprot:jgi/Galph1/3998/GphlegSOOS_G2695.1
MLKEGSRILADLKFQILKEGKPHVINSEEVFSNKKVVLFGLPGAFTPTCSRQHLPGFGSKIDEIKSKGIDTIACLAVNDPFVLQQWAEAQGVADKILMLADGGAQAVKKLGLDIDTGDFGGIRCRRFSSIIDNFVVKKLHLEEGTGFSGASSAETILKDLS